MTAPFQQGDHFMTLLAVCSMAAHRMFCSAIALPALKSELDFYGAFSFLVHPTKAYFV